MILKRALAVFIALILTSSIVIPSASAISGASRDEGSVETRAAISEESGEDEVFDERGWYIDPPPVDYDFSTIRVMLTTGETSRVEFDLATDFMVGNTLLHGTAGSPYLIKVTNTGSTVKLYNRADDSLIASGSRIELNRVSQNYELGRAKLTRCANSDITDFEYLGNFVFSVDSHDHVTVINVVPMAYYLFGCVSYEIGTNSPDEALKAQAIAIKTFSMYYFNSHPTDNYDVGDGYDSVVYQKYRGYRQSRIRTMQHCLAVVGEALSFNNTIVATFSTNTNGGETHVPSYALLGASFNPAYPVMLDDIEFENFTGDTDIINITYGGTGDSSRFRDFILYKMRMLFGKEATSVLAIENFGLSDLIPGTQRHYQTLNLTVRVATPNGAYTNSFSCPTSELNSTVIFDVDGSGDDYSSHKKMLEHKRLCFWFQNTSGGVRFICSGYGHGVGLSQQGAIILARDYNYSCSQILDYYFPLFEQISITERSPENAFSSTPVEPSPEPTPEPSTDPTDAPEPSDDPIPTETGEPSDDPTPPEDRVDIVAYGIVTGNTVYFRSEPTTDSPHIAVAHRNDHLDILNVLPGENGWFHAILRGQEGYISMKHSHITMFPAPPDGVFILIDGYTSMGANLRSEPRVKNGNVLAYLQRGTRLTAWARVGQWYYVITENGYQGFIHLEVVTMENTYYYTGVSQVHIKYEPPAEPSPAGPMLPPEDKGTYKITPEG